MKEYVCGLAFTPGSRTKESKLVLIRKTHPLWQAGRYNGVGGEMQYGEDAYEAMQREFHEEAGVVIGPELWDRFLVLSDGRGWKVHFFAVESELAREARTMTEEIVECKHVSWWFQFGYLVPNLHWIIPMAMQRRTLQLVQVMEIPVAIPIDS